MIDPQSSPTPSETQTEQPDLPGDELITFVLPNEDENQAEFIPPNDEITTFSE